MEKHSIEVSDRSDTSTVRPSPKAQKSSYNSHVPIRVAIFSAVLLPIVLVPYLLTRRRTLALKREVDKLQNTNRGLRFELDVARAELSTTKLEAQDTKAALRNVVADADAIRHRIEGLAAENEAGRGDLDSLLVESRNSRTQIAALRALGSSLADVAAFMHEIELQMGLQPLSGHAQRRVDRLRIAAFRLQNLQQPATSAKLEQPSGEGPPNTKAAETV